MIYTCTLNPSLDYYLTINKTLERGVANRSVAEYYEPGGKGTNVSIVLSNFQIPSVALGFLGGWNKDFYLSMLNKYNHVQALFTGIEDNTRVNIKILGEAETDINAKGPNIKPEEIAKFRRRLEKVTARDIFVLSGNIQEELKEVMEEIIADLSSRRVSIVLDTNPEFVKKCLKYQPILIKPNFEELEAMFNKKVDEDDIDSLIAMANSLSEEGAANVLVSLGNKGSFLVSGGTVLRNDALEGEVVNATGAGDSMVAGFILSLIRGATPFESYKYACAAAYATIFENHLATREDILKYIDKVILYEA